MSWALNLIQPSFDIDSKCDRRFDETLTIGSVNILQLKALMSYLLLTHY
jgi:hypothetical protein